MKVKNKTKYFLIFSIILLIGTSICYGLFFSSIKRSGERTSYLVNMLEDTYKAKSERDSLRKALDNTQGEQEKVDSHFIANDGIVAFVDTIEKMSILNGAEATINSIDVSSFDNSSTTIETVNVRVTLRGSFRSVLRTSSLIENLPYKIYTKAFSLNLENGSTDKNKKEKIATTWKSDIEFTVLKLK